jgi:hypothetical protein
MRDGVEAAFMAIHEAMADPDTETLELMCENNLTRAILDFHEEIDDNEVEITAHNTEGNKQISNIQVVDFCQI